MRKLLLTTALIGTTLISPGLVPAAQADHGWFAGGAGFRVGAAHISFVFGRPFGHAPAYYYRYDRPIRYSGHSCNRYCFHDAGHYYHHESCPLVQAHFRAYDVDPYYAYDRYAPRVDYGRYGYTGGYYSRGYRDHGRYDRYDRRDRYDRYDRYDRGDRYRDRSYRDRSYRDRDHRYRDGRGRDRDHRGRGRGHGQHRHHRGCGH